MSFIDLEFISTKEGVQLHRTSFVGFDNPTPLVCVRGEVNATVNQGLFGWTSGVRALSVLMLRHAATDVWWQIHNNPDQPLLSGLPGKTLTASLDASIAKQPQWVLDMFGVDAQGRANLRRMIRRVNPEGKRPSPIELSIFSNVLPSRGVTIVLDGTIVQDAASLLKIAAEIEESYSLLKLCLHEESKTKEIKSHLNKKKEPTRVSQGLIRSVGSLDTYTNTSKSENKNELLFLFTVSIRRPYFAELIETCSKAINQTFGARYGVVLRAVAEEDDHQADAVISKLFGEVGRLMNSVAALIVTPPTSSLHSIEAVAEVSARFAVPVIALTLPFSDTNPFKSRNLPYPPVIVSDNEFGAATLGKAAGKLVLRKGQIDKVKVLLVPGTKTRIDSIRRLNGFRLGLESSGIKFESEEFTPCEWNRDIAFRNFVKYLLSGMPEVPTIVFAANDQMALGIRDAILLMQQDKRGKKYPRIMVFGYDAVEEVRRLLMQNDEIFCGSVGQNLAEMANALTRTIPLVLQQQYSQIQSIENALGETLIPPIVVTSETIADQRLSSGNPFEDHDGDERRLANRKY